RASHCARGAEALQCGDPQRDGPSQRLGAPTHTASPKAGKDHPTTMNFSDLGKMKEMLSQARDMQQQMEHQLAETVVEGSSGGGVVTARMNGRKELLKLKIDPVVMTSSPGDVEMLEDLITAAINEAGRKADEKMKSGM